MAVNLANKLLAQSGLPSAEGEGLASVLVRGRPGAVPLPLGLCGHCHRSSSTAGHTSGQQATTLPQPPCPPAPLPHPCCPPQTCESDAEAEAALGAWAAYSPQHSDVAAEYAARRPARREPRTLLSYFKSQTAGAGEGDGGDCQQQQQGERSATQQQQHSVHSPKQQQQQWQQQQAAKPTNAFQVLMTSAKQHQQHQHGGAGGGSSSSASGPPPSRHHFAWSVPKDLVAIAANPEWWARDTCAGGVGAHA